MLWKENVNVDLNGLVFCTTDELLGIQKNVSALTKEKFVKNFGVQMTFIMFLNAWHTNFTT